MYFFYLNGTSFSFVQRNNFDYYKIIKTHNNAKLLLDNRFSNLITMKLFIQTSKKKNI